MDFLVDVRKTLKNSKIWLNKFLHSVSYLLLANNILSGQTEHFTIFLSKIRPESCVIFCEWRATAMARFYSKCKRQG